MGLGYKNSIFIQAGGMGRGAKEATSCLGGAWGAPASRRLSSSSSAAPAGMRGDSPRPDRGAPGVGSCPLPSTRPSSTPQAAGHPPAGCFQRTEGTCTPRARVSTRAESAARREQIAARGRRGRPRLMRGPRGRAGSRVPRLAQPPRCVPEP